MKEKLISSAGKLASLLPDSLNAIAWKKKNLLKSREKSQLPFQIMIYHRVLKKPDPFAMAPVLEKDFENQIKLYSENFRVIGLSQLHKEIQEGYVEEKTLCITFDDGYKDNFEVALPILNKYNLPATVFVATKAVDSQELLWYDKVLSLFSRSKENVFEFPELNISVFSLTPTENKRDAAHCVLGKLKEFDPMQRDSYIIEIAKQLKVDLVENTNIMLSWENVKELKGNGVEIGAHTHSHPILSKLNYEEALLEIKTSKEILEDKLQEEVSSFAYPNGGREDYNSSTIKAVQDSGLKLAVTTNHGTNTTKSNLFELNRRQTWESDPYSLYIRLLGDCIRAN